MNKWRSFIAGQIANRPGAEPKQLYDGTRERRVRHRTWTRYDTTAKYKRIAKRRAKKGYG